MSQIFILQEIFDGLHCITRDVIHKSLVIQSFVIIMENIESS